MKQKYWFAGLAYNANGQGETVAIHGHTFEEAAIKFFKKYEKLNKEPLAKVVMMGPLFFDYWIEEDEDKDFIPLHPVDKDIISFTGLRSYFIND